MTNFDIIKGGGGIKISKLAMLRASKGMTQVELAEVSDVNRDTISKLETGAEINILPMTLVKLANAFDMPVEEFQEWIK